MKIAINTNYNSAGSKVCVEDLSTRLAGAGFEITRNDWGNYKKYGLILFMAPDSQVGLAKSLNPSSLVGIMDPKLTKKWQRDEAGLADFLVVSSIEQRDVFLKYNKNVFIYYMFPELKEVVKKHEPKNKIIIGYHGNKIHLNCMETIQQALDSLGARYNIEFWAMYNYNNLGLWNKNLPQNCSIKHIQWSEENYYKALSKCDIGLVPSFIPVNKFTGVLSKKISGAYKYNKNDYLSRYKYSSNPGRIYVFSRLSIPVVADFTPSNAQVIQDGKSGFLVSSKEGWEWAIEKLIQDHSLRNLFAENLKNYIDENCSINYNFTSLLAFFKKIKHIRSA